MHVWPPLLCASNHAWISMSTCFQLSVKVTMCLQAGIQVTWVISQKWLQTDPISALRVQTHTHTPTANLWTPVHLYRRMCFLLTVFLHSRAQIPVWKVMGILNISRDMRPWRLSCEWRTVRLFFLTNTTDWWEGRKQLMWAQGSTIQITAACIWREIGIYVSSHVYMRHSRRRKIHMCLRLFLAA